LLHALLEKWKDKEMAQNMTRRNFAATAATGMAALGVLGASIKSADAYQGNMERALGSLQEALGSLHDSTPNKGGHRERAMDLVRQAIAETQAGIAFANMHGGGGRY
jgi:hypothetical protein